MGVREQQLAFVSLEQICKSKFSIMNHYVGRDGALVESIAFNRRVVGSTPALAVT